MKYVWSCAYCGRGSYFTDLIPQPGYRPVPEMFKDSADANVPKGTKFLCNFCEKPMLNTPSAFSQSD